VKAFASLTVVVLAVVAVGVSLVNGLPNLPPLRSYGAPPLRFEAAFPTSVVGKVEASLPVPGLALYAAWSSARGTAFSVEGIDSSALPGSSTSNNGGGYIYSTYLPVEKGRTAISFAEGFKTVRGSVGCGRTRTRYVQKLTAAQTKSPWIAAIDPLTSATKVAYLCEISEVVSGHGLKWVVTAVAATQSTVEQFVDSFKPLAATQGEGS
jgi:hypothetical protein